MLIKLESEKMEKIIEYAKQNLSNDFPSHDFSHTERVVKLSSHLALSEPSADKEVIEIAAWLHDIGRNEEDKSKASNKEKKFDHAEIGANKAEIFLKNLEYSQIKTDAVIHAIKTHRYRKKDPNSTPNTIEAKILYDADKLDSIGAIGVARAYSYAGEQKYKLYSDFNPDKEEDYKGMKKDPKKHTPVIEYQVKLKFVKDTIFTKRAKEIAEKRHIFISTYFKELENEITQF